MRNILILFTIITLIGISSSYAYSEEMKIATFHENIQIIIDSSITQNTTASVSLQSTSTEEMRIPIELEEKIREDKRIKSIMVTNENNCIIGVNDEICIMINLERSIEDKGIISIQKKAKEVGNSYINEINQALNLDTNFHSVYVHTNDESNKIMGSSGEITGKRIVSAVYTMPNQDTDYIYENLSLILIPKIIRDSDGFYNIAKNLSYEENTKVAFSIIPVESKLFMQLKVSKDYPNEGIINSKINPLEFLNIDNIKKSDYFSKGFYPLNSIIQIIITSPENINISNINGNIIPTQTIDNEKIPTDITKEGWIFDPEEGQVIQGKYIFGEKTSANNEELKFSLSGENIQDEKIKSDESILVVIIISIVAIAVAIFYLKGYKK
jgi:hypothetical protein